jgi:protein-S-isoprenylcysteine O-methyltransferase Ste14
MHRLRPYRLPGPSILHRPAGVAMLAAGIGLAVWSVRAAGHVDVAHPDQLVTKGPYAVSRNPMYEAWLMIHLGVGVGTRSGWTMLTVPVAAGLAHRAVLREERRLAAAFAAEFARYRSDVPRYLPSGLAHRRAATQI